MEKFFQKYSAAFDSGNAEKIASLYTLPCATSDGDGRNIFSNRESIVKKFKKNCQAMVEMGYQHSKFTILDIIDMDDTMKQ